MIRLLWLFLILDALVSLLFVVALLSGSPTAGDNLHGAIMRIMLELAALAIIEAVRERKV